MLTALKEKIKARVGVPDMFRSLERMKGLGFNPPQIIDVGAYEGGWTQKSLTIFPNAHYLMVEAMPSKEGKLREVATHNAHVEYSISLLGPETGREVGFSEIETASSVLEEHGNQTERTTRKTTALSDILKEYGIQRVGLLKLDVQGYELEVLKGYLEYLPVTEVILSEVSLLDIHKGVPLMRDYLNFVFDFGFVVYDICSTSIRRPLDGALWQTDLLFVKENSSFRADKRYNK